MVYFLLFYFQVEQLLEKQYVVNRDGMLYMSDDCDLKAIESSGLESIITSQLGMMHAWHYTHAGPYAVVNFQDVLINMNIAYLMKINRQNESRPENGGQSGCMYRQ